MDKTDSLIVNGDSLTELKKMRDSSIDLVVTDPPYVIETKGAGIYKQKDKQYVKELEFISNGFTEDILNELIRVMKKVNIYIFCSQKQIKWLLDYFLDNKNNKDHPLYKKSINWNIISWHKTNPIPACGNKYLTDTEFILFFREKGVKIYGSFNTKKTHYETPLNQKDKKIYNHPTVKPLNIVENFIENSSLPNQTVLDPYMGSGTVGHGCKIKGRNFIGIELIKEYCDIAKNRIDNCQQGGLINE